MASPLDVRINDGQHSVSITNTINSIHKTKEEQSGGTVDWPSNSHGCKNFHYIECGYGYLAVRLHSAQMAKPSLDFFGQSTVPPIRPSLLKTK